VVAQERLQNSRVTGVTALGFGLWHVPAGILRKLRMTGGATGWREWPQDAREGSQDDGEGPQDDREATG
jgi:hypothetical protein